MEGEIVIDRGETGIMNLDETEQAVMDELQLDFQKPRPPRRPATGERPVQQSVFQEDISDFANPTKQSAPPPPHQEDPIDYEESEPGENEEYEMPDEQPSPGYKTIDEEKADLINKLGRLEKRGFSVNKRLNAYSPVDELRTEVKRITYSIDVDKSVKFSRRMLIACVTGIEFLNKRYDPFDIQLDGWSENVMEGVDDYDEVFEELYVKYQSKMKMAPEVKLIMMLGGSAMMFHLTNSMFKSVIPNMNDVMKQNPDLMQNMMSAVQNTTSGGSAAAPPTDSRHDMKGPGLDISSLMGNIMMPPALPMNTLQPQPQTRPEPVLENDDDVSDIVSEAGEIPDEIKEIKVPAGKGKRGPRKKKVEINL